MDSFIDMSTRSGNKRHLSEQRILFIAEKERYTPAAPMGNINIFRVKLENAGKRITFSYLQPSIKRLSLVERSPSNRRNDVTKICFLWFCFQNFLNFCNFSNIVRKMSINFIYYHLDVFRDKFFTNSIVVVLSTAIYTF